MTHLVTPPQMFTYLVGKYFNLGQCQVTIMCFMFIDQGELQPTQRQGVTLEMSFPTMCPLWLSL